MIRYAVYACISSIDLLPFMFLNVVYIETRILVVQRDELHINDQPYSTMAYTAA